MGAPPANSGDLREGSDIQPPCRGPSTFERLGRVLRHLPDPSKASRVIPFLACDGRVEGGPARAPYCRVE